MNSESREGYRGALDTLTPKKYVFFPEWNKHSHDGDSAKAYLDSQLELWVKRKWKKRLAKKILKHRHLRRGLLFKEYLGLSFQVLGMALGEEILFALGRPSFASRIMKIERIENKTPDDTGRQP